jgi:hypothetical protein
VGLAVGAALATTRARADELVLLADPDFTMEAGIRTFDSGRRTLMQYERVFPGLFQPAGSTLGLARFAFRVAKLGLVDLPLSSLTTVFLHEVFGHGARAREFGASVRYQFHLPFPYSVLDDGQEFLGLAIPSNRGTGRDDNISFIAAGIEANHLAAHLALRRSLLQGARLHAADAIFYLQKLNYTSSFMSKRGTLPRGPSSDDVEAYTAQLADGANLTGLADRRALSLQLRTAYLWNLLDPHIYLSLYAIARSLGTGERGVKLPTVRVAGAEAWASLRFNLSPWGPEHYVGAITRLPSGLLVETSVRAASPGLYTSVGASVHVEQFAIQVGPRRVRAGIDVDIFSQPQYVRGVQNVLERPQVGGLAVSTTVRAPLFGGLFLMGKLGAKTPGYVQALPMREGLYGFVGVGFEGLPDLVDTLPGP